MILLAAFDKKKRTNKKLTQKTHWFLELILIRLRKKENKSHPKEKIKAILYTDKNNLFYLSNEKDESVLEGSHSKNMNFILMK